jgi:hypothetical protein
MVRAKMFPIKATPKADMAPGTTKIEPRRPTTTPPPRIWARLPPWSPAMIVSPAATPGGQVPEAGKILESKTL